LTLLSEMGAQASEQVQFPSLNGKLELTGLLDRPTRGLPGPAVVMMHGCSGLGSAKGPFALYRDWRDLLVANDFVTLMVDSAASRGFHQTCTLDVKEQTDRMWAERPSDAYAALAFLQSQSFVAPDKIALMGWSQGGGVVLETIPTHSLGRPNPPPAHEFAAPSPFIRDFAPTNGWPLISTSRPKAGPHRFLCSFFREKRTIGPARSPVRRF
jgi:dienelactone hydrolase